MIEIQIHRMAVRLKIQRVFFSCRCSVISLVYICICCYYFKLCDISNRCFHCQFIAVSLLYNCSATAMLLQCCCNACSGFVVTDYHCSRVDCYFLSVQVCFRNTLLIIIFLIIASVGIYFEHRKFSYVQIVSVLYVVMISNCLCSVVKFVLLLNNVKWCCM